MNINSRQIFLLAGLLFAFEAKAEPQEFFCVLKPNSQHFDLIFEDPSMFIEMDGEGFEPMAAMTEQIRRQMKFYYTSSKLSFDLVFDPVEGVGIGKLNRFDDTETVNGQVICNKG